MSCARCGRDVLIRPDGLCFGCHVRSVTFTFRGAHLGRANWNDTTVAAERRAIYEGAKREGIEIERAR